MVSTREPNFRVSYEDVANPRRHGTVVEVVPVMLVAFTRSGRAMVPAGNEYLVRWDDGTETVSDLRQHGWRSEW